jgi:L-ascorbate 6-phosphate lactonase
MSSQDYMRSIQEFRVPSDAIALWYFGQNGFVVKDTAGPLIGIDLYLTNSCASTFRHLPFRLDRQLPVFVEPEDIDIDVFIATHSHQDHADPDTIRRIRKTEKTTFAGPFDCMKIFRECGVAENHCKLLHPGHTLTFDTTSILATFALPTDATDLNHTGVLLSFLNGITFYNTGDTAWAEHLPALLPTNTDVCAICINGGFNNLGPQHAATIIKELNPHVVVPSHYDMMVNNIGSPEMFRVALELAGSRAVCTTLNYYEPWLYKRPTA